MFVFWERYLCFSVYCKRQALKGLNLHAEAAGSVDHGMFERKSKSRATSAHRAALRP